MWVLLGGGESTVYSLPLLIDWHVFYFSVENNTNQWGEEKRGKEEIKREGRKEKGRMA